MELASMLAGDRFTDRPASVCPIIGSILRLYNDNIDDRRRQDLYRFAADAVGTRGDYALALRRAEAALAWARETRCGGARRSPVRRQRAIEPSPDSGPDEIAYYVVGSLRFGGARLWPGDRPSDNSHRAILDLVDRLIAFEPELRELPDTVEVPEQQPIAAFVERGSEAILDEEIAAEQELLGGGAEPTLREPPARTELDQPLGTRSSSLKLAVRACELACAAGLVAVAVKPILVGGRR
jgi:hypothetical protein